MQLGVGIPLGDTHRVAFGSADSTGAATNADSTPTVVVLEAGVAMAYAPTVTSIATGLYEAAIVCSAANGFVEGRSYSAYVTVTVSGVTGRDALASFIVRGSNALLLSDTVRVCLGTAASSGAATNADSTPTITVLEQGSTLAYSPTVTNITTGLYESVIAMTAANGFEAGKEYTAYATATVSSITGRDGLASFRIRADYPTQANATTAQNIRDRCYTLIEALTPTSLAGDKFRRYRNEGDGNFDDFAETNPAASLRRFQVRDDGAEDPPEVSNTLTDMRHVTMTVRIAYPHSARYGAENAMDRDDVIDQDWGLINGKIGIYGRGNFSGTNDCTPLGATREVEIGESVDILVVTARFSFYRSVT